MNRERLDYDLKRPRRIWPPILVALILVVLVIGAIIGGSALAAATARSGGPADTVPTTASCGINRAGCITPEEQQAADAVVVQLEADNAAKALAAQQAAAKSAQQVQTQTEPVPAPAPSPTSGRDPNSAPPPGNICEVLADGTQIPCEG